MKTPEHYHPCGAKIDQLPAGPWVPALLLVLGLCVCAPGAGLKIGLLSAPQDPLHENFRRGASLALQHLNESPGPKLELALRGRPGQWGTEGDEAVALALDEGVCGMIAPPSGSASHQVMQVAGRTRVPVISLSPDSSVTGSGIPWVLRIAPRADLEAECLFSSATNGKARAWAALVPEGRAGREAAKDLQTAASRSGCALGEPVRLPDDSRGWNQTLQTVLDTKPDALLLWQPPATAGTLARLAREKGFAGLLAGPAMLHSPLFLTNAAGAAEGFLIPALEEAPGNNTTWNQFRAGFTKAYGTQPDFAAVMAYDAALVLAQVARFSAGQPVFKSFPLQQEIKGASGTLRFDAQGNRQVKLSPLTCSRGEFREAQLVPGACPDPGGGTLSPRH